MDGSNAAAVEVISINKENANQSEVSPVPDLVSTNNSAINKNDGSNATNPTNTDSPSAEKTPHTPKPTSNPPAPVLPRGTSAASEASVKNRSSREEKSRKKDDKSVDHVLRALNSLNTTEEKLAAMCKKYTDIFDEHRKLQLLHKQSEKRYSMLQREKEQLQAEHSKAILTRSRLENLCRELQRQNKAIKDESLLKIREEEEKRKEVSAKFQTTMNEITTLMQQNNDKNMKLRDDNIDMTAKLKSICEQYEMRQQQVERISKQMQLEQQLADAKLSKLKIEMTAEREILLREKQQLLLELQQYQQRCTDFQATEVSLRNQISMYNDKYDEFQKALARSNDVFGGFKGEMEKMSKKICKLEKETSSWKQRWERSHNALLEMAADKQKSEQELAIVSRQLATLQGLCRTLQTERSSLLAKLKIFQVGGHEVLDKPVGNPAERCKNMCEHSINHIDQSISNHVEQNVSQVDQAVNNHIDQTMSQADQSVNNPNLTQYNQDILASFKEATDNLPAPAMPVPGSPLPDVVGTTNSCVVGTNPDINGALCERLDSVVLNPSVSKNTSDENPAIVNPQSGLPEMNQLTTTQDNSAASDVSLVQILGDPQPPQTVMNGEPIPNGTVKDTNQPQNQPSSPKSPKGSPTKTSDDSGKKTKESTKKKKK